MNHRSMKKYKRNTMRIRLLPIILLILLASASCDRDRNNPGWDFFPDMFYSNAYETNTENPVFENNQTQQMPAEGTIPRDIIPHQYPNTKEGMVQAGIDLSNPVENSSENVERGEEVYNVFCTHCHGETGDGKGSLHTSGKYVYPPASLITNKMKEKPEGEIYHSITVGYGIMGAHGSQIRQEDRWKVILYMRDELQK